MSDCCEVWIDKKVFSRKEHTCDVCHLPIPSKTLYRRINYVFDGSAGEHKLHEECYGLHEDCSSECHDRYGEGIPVSEVRDFLSELDRMEVWDAHIEKIRNNY